MPDASAAETARIVVENDGTDLRCVWIEPWGEDYWLRPEEKLTVRGLGSGTGWFHLCWHADGAGSVYVEGEGTRFFDVTVNDRDAACGHQRPPGAFDE